MGELVSQREFQRRLGLRAVSSVQKAIRDGRITAIIDGKLDYEAAKEQYQSTRTVGKNNRAGELELDLVEGDEDITFTAPSGRSWALEYTVERALKVAEERKLLELEVAEAEGKLHQADDIEKLWTGLILAARAKVLGIASKTAPGIASMTGCEDVAMIQAFIEEVCREALAELGRYDFEDVNGRGEDGGAGETLHEGVDASAETEG